jgi:tRNA(Ile)-lysidine synthase
VNRAALAAYASQNRLSWIHDPMNEAAGSDRGWLRERILPAIREHWPGAAATVARTARHLAEASRLLAEIAAEDADALLDEGRLSLEGLVRLSPERQVNVVRWWLRREGLRPPPARRLVTGLGALLDARRDSLPALRWPGGELRRYRGRLYALAPLPTQATGSARDGAGFLDLGPGLGRFGLVAGEEGGLAARAAASATIRFRAGGESLRPHPERPRKRLKDLCQESGVVPWMRDRLPLVFVGDRLAAVGNLWLDAEFSQPAGTPAFKPVWEGRPRLF